MLFARIATSDPLTPAANAPEPSLHFTLEGQVQNGLNVWLPLKNPAQMPALLGYLRSAEQGIHEQLEQLHYVHFARFLPSPDLSTLWVITEFDGGLSSYIMDFVGVVGEQFDQILQFIAGAPPLPVQRYAREFAEYITNHNLPISVWSAYPEITVIDILRGARRL